MSGGALTPFVEHNLQRPVAEVALLPGVAVPQAALQTLEGRTTVFVQTEPGVFVRHFVETGHTLEGFTEILSGVVAEDVIVSEGSFVLKSQFAKALGNETCRPTVTLEIGSLLGSLVGESERNIRQALRIVDGLV